MRLEEFLLSAGRSHAAFARGIGWTRARRYAAIEDHRDPPVSIIPELRNATRSQLTGIEILPGGDGLHWEALDFTISVPGLVASLFGRSVWMSELGRLGGARSTLAKAEAARRNGLRGGRPRLG